MWAWPQREESPAPSFPFILRLGCREVSIFLLCASHLTCCSISGPQAKQQWTEPPSQVTLFSLNVVSSRCLLWWQKAGCHTQSSNLWDGNEKNKTSYLLQLSFWVLDQFKTYILYLLYYIVLYYIKVYIYYIIYMLIIETTQWLFNY